MSKAKSQQSGVAAEIGKKRPFDYPEVEAYVNIIRTHEYLAACSARFFKDHGITGPQYNALRILRGHGQRMRTHQVAADMVTREPDITRLLDRLVDRGLVARERCPRDRRVVWVELTPEGSALLKSLDKPVAALHQQQLGHLGPRKLQQLSKLLFEARHPES